MWESVCEKERYIYISTFNNFNDNYDGSRMHTLYSINFKHEQTSTNKIINNNN